MSKVEIAPGVTEVTYRLPGKNYLDSNGIERLPTKTVYDPNIYSDARIADMAHDAAARGMMQYRIDGILDQYIKINGINFYVPINEATRTIKTVFPLWSKGVK